ncbi:hypothetical protein KC19_8G050100 [Ceratodon purpureus]|uniref:TIR domain-containing protein n=1 Tax=Ceratodon purpureus TaxID=3225 RepID=A0A8T0GZY5_CERPU|nr:hypothetical protein KC19_8G050100 [Ceratodon purpureus]
MDDQSLELSRPGKRHRGQCSSSFAATDVDYDVFLNHRGPDVKAGFISHLDEALRIAGLNPFLDKASLRKGRPAFGSINDALNVAKIHVAVVSKGYAESKYCLTELVAMMRSGKPVIPVFYDVEPVDLRWMENGPFKEAFEKHKLKRTPEQVEEWRDALLKLAEITGICFRLSDYKGNEAELKREVVDVVLSFTCRDELVPIEHHLVGVEEQMNACIMAMEEFMSGPTRLLGFVGMGGIGKTTLAKAIYNHFVACKKFQAMSFLQVNYNPLSSTEEVGSGLSKRLQKQLLMDIFHVPHKNQGSYKRWFDRIYGQGPVLVVLDDLRQKSEFDQVILDMSLLAPGSCIIVTSRDRYVLNEISGQCNFFLHEVKPLGSDDSQQLFNLHAFGNGEVPPKFKSVANDVSKACGGLPLALKVVGSSLIGKKSDEDLEYIWPEAADALKEDADVMDVLRWSYNCLSKQEKMMFLDIACIFCGWWRDEAMEIWKSCKESSCCGLRIPHKSLAKLIDKSLIFIDVTKGKQGGGVLAMHGLLQELGRNVGMDDGSHVWIDRGTCGVEVINQGPIKVRALNLGNGGEHEVEFEYFTKMTNLHFLVLDGCFINGDLTIISKKLRSLRWRHMPMIQRPPVLNLTNLISLDFSHNTKAASLWAESNPALEGCPNLLNLNMWNCTSIITLPDSIGRLSRLQLLDLDGCRNLQKLPSTIGQLTHLKKLRLQRCESLESLPDSIPALPLLQELLMYTCTSMSKVPETMGLMTGLAEFETDLATEWHAVAVGQQHGLKELTVRKCSDEGITWLDRNSSLAHLHLLSYFQFYDCPAMSKLPHTIGLLTNLDWLDLWRCENLRELPNCIGQLKLLRILALRRCSSLETLPDCLGALTSLEYLRIAHCRSLTKLPESIGHLSRLQSLTIKGCGELQPLPESLRQLSALVWLGILDCGSLEGLGVLRVLPGLRIWGCTSVTNLPGSCLIVLDRNYRDPSWYKYDDGNQYYSVRGDLTEMRVVEANDCGFLRLVQDAESGRSILQRVHKVDCCKLVMLKDREAI